MVYTATVSWQSISHGLLITYPQQMSITQSNANPALLKKNPWNTNVVSPENELKLQASIERFGMFKPIVVRTLADGSLQILGGQHRNDIAVRKSMPTVPIMNLGQIDDDTAKEIGLVDNGRFGEDDTLALAELLKGMASADELATFMPMSDAEFASITAAVNIELDDLDLPPDEDSMPTLPATKLPQTHQIMRFKVPVDDVAAVTEAVERTMKLQGFTESDSLTNAGDALVFLLKGGQE